MRCFLCAAFFALLVTGCATVSNAPGLPPHGEGEISFIDYYGKPQVAQINQNIRPNKFDRRLFRRKKSKMFYDDPAYTVRQGVDISRHDGKVNWKKVKKAGFDFVILRAAYRGYQTGILHIDEHFFDNISGATEAGLDVGVYVFSQAISEEEALEEAALVLSLIKEEKITLPVVFDPENIGWEDARTDNVTPEQFTRNTLVFCEHVKEAGYEPMVYANLTWQTMRLDMERISEYKMWYADYGNTPKTPYHFDYWQHYSPKKVPGVQRKCDVNIMISRYEGEENNGQQATETTTVENAAEESVSEDLNAEQNIQQDAGAEEAGYESTDEDQKASVENRSDE